MMLCGFGVFFDDDFFVANESSFSDLIVL